MLEMLRKKLIDAGIDPAVGSIDYWGTELEGVLLDMYDQGAASEREECAQLCDAAAKQSGSDHEAGGMYWCAEAIRARGNHEQD